VGELATLGALAAVGVFYGIGVSRAWARAGRGRIVRTWQPVCFGAALLTIGVALGSGLDGAAGHSLSAHMAQHVLLISVAAPLFVVGAPMVAFSYALDAPDAGRKYARRLHRATGRWAAALVGVALVLHSATVWLWHLPAIYGDALADPALHAVEHAAFFWTAVFLWWAALGAGRRAARGVGVLLLFVTTLPMNALGLMMTLAHSPWYSAYVHHGSVQAALDDQALAGVIMWGFGGVAALVGAFALFVAWLEGMERATPSRVVPPVLAPPVQGGAR
jgi:cytochrome c oxidase assembly factor CtaG